MRDEKEHPINQKIQSISFQESGCAEYYSVGKGGVTRIEAALIAMRTVMDNGPMPKRLDDALTWRQCDERARAMCDATLQPKETK